MQATDPVARFAQAIESATIPALDVFTPDVAVDATVPNWRMSIHGDEQVREAFSHWYADPGQFDRQLVQELFGLHFLRRHEHVLIAGQVGTGKSFVAQALGNAACRAGYS